MWAAQADLLKALLAPTASGRRHGSSANVAHIPPNIVRVVTPQRGASMSAMTLAP